MDQNINEFTTDMENFILFYNMAMIRSKSRNSKFHIIISHNEQNQTLLISFNDLKNNRIVMEDEILVNEYQARLLINTIRNNFIKEHYISLPVFKNSNRAKTGFNHCLTNTIYELEIELDTEMELKEAKIAQSLALEYHNNDVKNNLQEKPISIYEVNGKVKNLIIPQKNTSL